MISYVIYLFIYLFIYLLFLFCFAFFAFWWLENDWYFAEINQSKYYKKKNIEFCNTVNYIAVLR